MPDDIEFLGNDKNGNNFTWVVDPNPIGKDAVPPEDLFVWVNFKALPKSRSIIETDGTYSSDFSSSKGIEFITSTEQNGKGYVTTNYTNVGGSQTSEKEAFGIEKISVKYGASLVPQVHITFVDVRGAGLFNGYEFEDEKGFKYNSSEFSTFFRLPHPLFELSVKGFYGKAVTYCLHLRKWSAKYDATKGNFVIEADFIGYTFAFLADVLLKYVMAINSTEDGVSSLEKQNKLLLDKRPNANEIIPLDDFMIRLGQLTRIAKDFKDNSGEYQELLLINTILFELDKLLDTVGRPVNENNASVFGSTLPFPQIPVNRDQVFVRDVGVISEDVGDTHDVVVEDLGVFVKEFNERIEDNVSTYSYLTQYKIQNFNLKTPVLSYEINDASVEIIKEEVFKDGLTSSNNIITTSALRSRLNLRENSTKKFYIINYHEFRKEVSDLLSDVQEKQAELQRVVNEQLNKKLGQEIGFNLTIENVFNIILGNVEAFLDVVYNTALAADNPSIQEQRISKLTNIRTDINSEDARIYPFPAVYDSVTGEEVWIGDVVGEDDAAFPEIQLVKKTINALVSANTKQANDRKRNNTKREVNVTPNGWIPVSPIDYQSNPLENIDSFSYDGNQIPDELANIIVSRAISAYEDTLYNDNRFNNIAQTEGAYAASQTINNVVKQVFKSFNTNDFVQQVLEKSGFKEDDDFDLTSGVSYSDDKGFHIGGLDDNPINMVVQNKMVLPNEVSNTIDRFGKTLENTLIPTKFKEYHRKLDKNGLFVYGDTTDYFWNEDVFKNLRKFYKNRTSNDLQRNKPLNAPAISIVNDLTIFDGQINSNIDFSSNNNRKLKFTNNARKYIGINPIKSGDNPTCLFESEYYKAAQPQIKAYLFLLTLPINDILSVLPTLTLSGLYKFSKIHLAWISAQFFRVSTIEITGQDIFEDLLDNTELENVLGVSKYSSLKRELADIQEKTKSFLPDISIFSDDFVQTMANYFQTWVENDYIEQNESKLEYYARVYCETSSNGIYETSSEYSTYKSAYNNVLGSFIDVVNVLITNPKKILKTSDEINAIFGIKSLDTATLSTFVSKWLETYKKVVRIENNANNNVTGNQTSLAQDQEFYVEDKDIKISTYNHFKTLYDKWIAGNKNGQIHNFCSYGGGSPRSSQLIDRFHFIDRTWSYIGDRAVINPKPLLLLSSNADINLYSYIGRIMQDSKFDFHVLPTWVNYRNINDVREMWQPQVDVGNASSGAAYICMYMGGNSKVLDMGKKVAYVNDGFDLREFDTEIPKGFKDRRTPAYLDNLEDNEKFKYNMVVFRVGHADQNQSIFKSINVSQEEHRETNESLVALSDAFDNKGGTKRFYKGVNLYNVFALRSYKCTVTSLGNMQVHPLNYFQLDNVPFFHGAYMITKVEHSIKAHYVETKFEGRRVPRFVVPVVEFATTYVNIPLTDTLFKPSKLNESIVRPLTPEDDEGFISDGEDTATEIPSELIPSSTEFLEAEEEDNVLLEVNFQNKNTVFNFYIKPSVTPEFLDSKIPEFFNPNSVTGFGLRKGLCYSWTKLAMAELGVLQTPFNGIDAWTFFSGWDDTGTRFVTNEQFTNNINGWTNQSMKEAGIPDGSFIACYYPTSDYIYRSIDRMLDTGISQYKIDNLSRLKPLDTKPFSCKGSSLACDSTPIAKKIYSVKVAEGKHNRSQMSDNAFQLDGKLLPFAPVTHSAVYINGHCFHSLGNMQVAPTRTMKIVAYYPFKDKLYRKAGGTAPNSSFFSRF